MSEKADKLEDIRHYELTRYRSLDQRIVHSVESRIITDFINSSLRQGDSILDIPCGYGRFTQHLVHKPVRVFVGDINSKMLLRVKERFQNQVRYTKGDIMELPYGDDTFHGLVSIRLFQHFHTPAERITGFSEIARVTSRWAVVSVYTSSFLHHKLMRLFRTHHRITMATNKQIREEIEQSGLQLIKAKKILPGIHAHTILLVAPE